MAAKRPGQPLRGRARECALLRDLFSSVRSGSGQALVLRGEGGVGKTALLDYAVRQSPEFRLARVVGVESDMELAYAGLHQLCAPLLDHQDELPQPQREALDVAFGRGVGQTPDRFLVGLAVLSLLAATANTGPLLCVIDDAQWLDQVSVQTLSFVARRLLAEPVALVFAARNVGAEALTGLPELAIDGLSDQDARELLDSVVLGRLDERVRDRIVAETRGIPLALLEVPQNLSAEQLAGGFANLPVHRFGGEIEESFTRRIRALPPQTQRLVLAAAAEPLGDPALFLRAAGHLGIPVDALAPAEAAGLIEFGSRMRFHHPLVRSAAYRVADPADRRAIHQALAEATDPQLDPDRRAWHAANAAAGPDDSVAADLESSAGRAQVRGGVAAAAAFLERATTLTSDPALRGSRAIAAAQAKRDAAAPEAAYELLAIAELGPLSERQRGQVARLRAQVNLIRSRGSGDSGPRLSDAVSQLVSAARQLENVDDDLARETYIEALAAAMYSSRCGHPAALAEVAEAARAAVGRVEQLRRPIDFLLSGMANRITGGASAGSDDLRTALELWCTHAERNDGQALRWLTLAFPIIQETAAGELWDDGITHRLATAIAGYARESGALAVLPPALTYRAGAHLLAGEFATAATLLEEADSISAATGHTPVRYHSLMIAAWRGAPDEARRLIDAASADAADRGEGRLLGVAGYATAALYNGLGRYDEAFVAAQRACEHEDLGFYSWCLFELIEAAARTGQLDASAAALRLFEERAGASGTDWGLGAVANARALLADNDAAEVLFTEAIARFERTRVVLHLARVHLNYGEWLRRANRRLDARQQLNKAHEMFTRMGAQGYAERARRELVATGEKVRKQRLRSGDELTAQEAQIGRLAGNGLTNQEIGAQLFISTHTVEWHLRKVFVKLGITSRRQLRTFEWAS